MPVTGSRDSGLWKTSDYGKNWEEVTAFPVLWDTGSTEKFAQPID